MSPQVPTNHPKQYNPHLRALSERLVINPELNSDQLECPVSPTCHISSTSAPKRKPSTTLSSLHFSPKKNWDPGEM